MNALKGPDSKNSPVKDEKRTVEITYEKVKTIAFSIVENRNEIRCRFNHTEELVTERILETTDSDKYRLEKSKRPLNAVFTRSASRAVREACTKALNSGVADVVSVDEVSLKEHVKANADLFLTMLNRLVDTCENGRNLRSGSPVAELISKPSRGPLILDLKESPHSSCR